jgi:hypothetical protein
MKLSVRASISIGLPASGTLLAINSIIVARTLPSDSFLYCEAKNLSYLYQ